MPAFNAPITLSAPPPRVLAASGPGAVVYGATGNTTWYDLVRPVVLKPGAVQRGAMLELSVLFDFLANGAGRSIQVTFNGVAVLQSYPTATVQQLHALSRLFVANDLKSVLLFSQNANDIVSPGIASASPFGTKGNVPATVAIDFTNEVTVRVQGKPVNGDSLRLAGFSLVYQVASGDVGVLLPANAVSCWGDSLTAGTGATSPSGGYVSRLRQALAGRGVTNFGIGGQTSQQVVDRMLGDKVMGRNGIVLAWIGRNDVGTGGSLIEKVMVQHERAATNLAAGATYLPCTITPTETETAGSANHNAILAANTAIKSAYPNTIDLFTVLATEPNGTIPSTSRSDATHLNDAGYEIVKTQVMMKLAALDL